MSYVDGGTKRFRLSPCSEQMIRDNFKKLKQECLDVKAQHNYQKDYRMFPGQTMRERHYCRKMLKKEGRQKVFVIKPPNLTKTCKMQCCTIQMGHQHCLKTKIPDGMACSKNKTCKRGVCGVHTWEQFK
ncbi:uncharacterized protein LOC125940431 [Dermacentor silvarum]|nr:uncharacterized protein LOC125940431 [Dermacentor silvarum]